MPCSFFYKFNRLIFFGLIGSLILFSGFYQVFSQIETAPVLRVGIEDQNGNLISDAAVKIIFSSNKRISMFKR